MLDTRLSPLRSVVRRSYKRSEPVGSKKQECLLNTDMDIWDVVALSLNIAPTVVQVFMYN